MFFGSQNSRMKEIATFSKIQNQNKYSTRKMNHKILEQIKGRAFLVGDLPMSTSSILLGSLISSNFSKSPTSNYHGFGAPTSNSRRFSMEHRSEITSFCFGSVVFANEGSQNVFFGSQNSATF